MVTKEQFTPVADGLIVLAPAKINLSLLIAGKRPDSFHEIETLMTKINLFDELLIENGLKKGLELICKGPHWAPQGKENLVYRACEMLLKSCNYKADLKITLTKNIPAGSGLGSASSDAAAALIGINKLLNLDADKAKISEIAARLGSDVPFFLGGPLAVCTGKGEKIKKIDKKFNFSALLFLPDVTVSTKTVYANYKHNKAEYNQLSAKINGHIRKNRFDLVSQMCVNMLAETCFGLHKELYDLKAEIESKGIGPLCLSGSGSSMFCITDGITRHKAVKCRRTVVEKISCKSVIICNNRW